MTIRPIRTLHPAYRDDIGDLQTRRPLPGPLVSQLDPFLFLNHHGPQTYRAGNTGLPFGPHPHRGFETVTFIVDGDLMHRDSGGHESVIRAGGVQWMTAGRGLIHEELSSAEFKRQGGPLEILQLWVNLPARLKMTDPHYVGLQKEAIPVAELDGGRVHAQVIAGALGGVTGPFEPLTDVQMATVRLDRDGRFLAPVATGRNVLLYVVRGAVTVGGAPVDAHHLVELERDGDQVEVVATEPAALLFGHATPYREPVVAHGPFVMNTRAEILQAIRDYEAGRFGSSVPKPQDR